MTYKISKRKEKVPNSPISRTSSIKKLWGWLGIKRIVPVWECPIIFWLSEMKFDESAPKPKNNLSFIFWYENPQIICLWASIADVGILNLISSGFIWKVFLGNKLRKVVEVDVRSKIVNSDFNLRDLKSSKIFM